jgi:MYXO-CTERM domain-containing protein
VRAAPALVAATSLVALALALALAPARARADAATPVTVSGHVVEAHGRWTAGGTRLVTDAVIQTADGTRVAVSELGGEADGLAMVTLPGPAVLASGMDVTVAAHAATTRRGHPVLAVDAVTVRGGGAADPFVREGPTPSSHYLYWASGCVFMTYADEGTAEIAGDGELAILDAALATWNSGIAGCSHMTLMSAGRDAGREVGKDYVNVIKFRDTKWCAPATADDPERCHDATAAGITTLTYVKDPSSDRDGEIVDADVELNGLDFAISSGGTSLGHAMCQADLANTITHELGHVLGLEHTCVGPGDPARVDGDGNPVPSCSTTIDPLITEATMYPYQDCGETKKASLEADDIAGACAIAPAASDPGTCDRVGSPGGCCQAGAGGGGAPLALIGLVAVGLGRRRRRRRPSG